MTHHALLLEGDYEWALTCLPDACRCEGVDVIHYRGQRMGIDEVRGVIAAAYQTPLDLPVRHFLLAFDQYTVEAQNALLKLLEEPPQTAQFYLIVGNRNLLLPTLRSRLVELGTKRGAHGTQGAREFFAASYGERLAQIADKTAKKDDAWATEILNALEVYAEEKEDRRIMHVLNDLRPLFLYPGASKKMILEHVALLLPPNT